MLLHFIFVIKRGEEAERDWEFAYVRRMAEFYGRWISSKFSIDYNIKCDMMITEPRSMLQRLDTHDLVRDHRMRGEETYHFYLAHFRPFWTDCTCEGYHAENFGMIWWKRPKTKGDIRELMEKNCTTVSHEIAHEMLRRRGYKRYVQDVHDVWTRHNFDALDFEQYDSEFEPTDSRPEFLTMNISEIAAFKNA